MDESILSFSFLPDGKGNFEDFVVTGKKADNELVLVFREDHWKAEGDENISYGIEIHERGTTSISQIEKWKKSKNIEVQVIHCKELIKNLMDVGFGKPLASLKNER